MKRAAGSRDEPGTVQKDACRLDHTCADDAVGELFVPADSFGMARVLPLCRVELCDRLRHDHEVFGVGERRAFGATAIGASRVLGFVETAAPAAVNAPPRAEQKALVEAPRSIRGFDLDERIGRFHPEIMTPFELASEHRRVRRSRMLGSVATVQELIERYRPHPAPYEIAATRVTPTWLDELDLKPAPPHLRMGTHSLDLDNWFVLDEHFDTEMQLRQRLLGEQRSEVFALLPSAEDAADETLALMKAWLGERGRATETTDSNPLAAAGELVQDDLCLMVHRDGDWHLDGGILCFPSVWRLSEKLGKPTGQVHSPVHHYAEELSSKVDRFFDRLTPDRPVWRRNLSLKPTNALYLPVSKGEVERKAVAVNEEGAPYWLRTERQTLRRLPKTGAILFGIRTQVAPIAVLLNRRDRARDLLSMYESWDAAMGQFKMADSDIGANLLPWLARISA